MAITTKERAELRKYLEDAAGIAWDTCHKIYVLMDEEEMAKMREYEYDPLISRDEMTPRQMSATISRWYKDSCGLRFVGVISNTNDFDENRVRDSYIAVVPQR